MLQIINIDVNLVKVLFVKTINIKGIKNVIWYKNSNTAYNPI